MLVATGGEKFRRAMSLWLYGTLRGGWFNMQQNWRGARQAEAEAEQEKQATVKTVAMSVLRILHEHFSYGHSHDHSADRDGLCDIACLFLWPSMKQ